MLPNELPAPFLKTYSALSPTAKALLDISAVVGMGLSRTALTQIATLLAKDSREISANKLKDELIALKTQGWYVEIKSQLSLPLNLHRLLMANIIKEKRYHKIFEAADQVVKRVNFSKNTYYSYRFIEAS
jgi:hypothetical protein